MVSQKQLIRHYEQNEADALVLLGSWRALQDQVGELRAAAADERDEAMVALGTAYLPELAMGAVTRAEKLTGYRGFTRRDPLRAMDHEKHVLEHTIRRIEADDRYVKRRLLVGPGGELTLVVDEAKSMLEPWEKECAPYEACEGWEELLATGYDTSEYSVSFFEKRYWTLWRLGDLVCEALGVSDFGDDVLPAFEAADRQRRIWRAQVADAEANVEEVHELVRTRDRSEARIPRLPEIYLEACHRQLAEFFTSADLSLLEQWLVDDAGEGEPDRAVLLGLRRAAGASAKVRLLDELLREGVHRAIGDLQQRKAKFARKQVKYARGKYVGVSFPDSAMDSKFRSKIGKYRERPTKLGKLARRIADYDRYGRYDLANNAEELWFYEMTGKRPPSQFGATRRWYDRYPDVVPVLDEVPIAAEALVEAAAAMRQADDLGYLS